MSEVWTPGTPSQLVYPCPEAMNDACCMFALAKISDANDNSWLSVFQLDVDATGPAATRVALGRTPDPGNSIGDIYYSNSNGIIHALDWTDADAWCRIWVSRSAAAATTFGKAAIGTTTPTTAAGGALADGLSNAGGVVKVGGDDDPFNGKFAAYAWWNGTPPSDAALAACVSTADLLALAPSHAYDAANRLQTDLVGTNHLTSGLSSITQDGADNPVWTYSGGAAAVGPPSFGSKHRSMRALIRR